MPAANGFAKELSVKQIYIQCENRLSKVAFRELQKMS